MNISKEERIKSIIENLKIDKLSEEDWDYIVQDNIKLADLLKCDENNITYLEQIIDLDSRYKNNILVYIKSELYNNFQALCIYYKNCKSTLWEGTIDPKSINEDLLFKNVDSDKILLDYVKQKVFDFRDIIGNIKNNVEIIDWIIENSYDDLLLNLNPNIVEKIFQNDGDGYLIDRYYNNKDLFIPLFEKYPDYVMDYCEKKNDYSFIVGFSQKFYKEELRNSKTVAETLLEKGIFPYRSDKIWIKQILDLFLKHNRIDLLWNGDLERLLETKENEEKSYLDIMIEKQKEGIDVNLEKIFLGDESSLLKAKALLKIADNGLIDYIPTDLNFYLKKGLNHRSVSDELFEMPHSNKLALAFKLLGITGYDIENKSIIPSGYEAFRDSYYENYTLNHVSVCPELLDELKKLFYSDGKSNTKVIDFLIKSYNYLTSEDNIDHELFVNELKQLIEIKRNNMDNFVYELDESESLFDSKKGCVIVSDLSIPTINHETSHALHFYLADKKCPENYIELCNIIRNDPGAIKKLTEWVELYNKVHELTESKILNHKKALELYYDTKVSSEEGLAYISKILSKTKEELKETFKGYYDEEVLDTILNKTYSVEEYFNSRKEKEINEIKAFIIDNDNCGLGAISDIIDAVYAGRFLDGKLVDENGNTIKGREGHGIIYYMGENTIFKEMIAEYGTIIKSKYNKDISLQFLRYFLGNSLFNLLKNTYENDIIGSKKYMEMETKGYER